MIEKQILCLLALFIGTSANVGFAQEKTAPAKRGLMELVVDLTGTIESDSVEPLKFDNEQLIDLQIGQVADHGTMVSKGQKLLVLEKEELEKKAHELRQAHRLAELAFQDKQLAAQEAQRLNDLNREAKQRAIEEANTDFQYWEEVTRLQRMIDIEDARQYSKDSLQDAIEEYNQLKQMYDEDELVEESEKLVLSRQQRELERAKKSFERSEQSYERTLKVEMPRQEKEYRENHLRTMMRLERELETLPNNVEREQMDMEEAEIAFQKSQEAMEGLEKEMAATSLIAPFDGVVYHGSWPVSGETVVLEVETVVLEVEGKVVPKSTALTMMSMEGLSLSVNLTEEQLSKVETGMGGYATPTAFPRQATKVRVSKIEMAPNSDKTYVCKLTLADQPSNLMPGMTCGIKVRAYQNEQALTVPAATVFTDDGTNFFVYVSHTQTIQKAVQPAEGEADPKPEPEIQSTVSKVEVRIGLSVGGQTEILAGLNEGDQVMLSRGSK